MLAELKFVKGAVGKKNLLPALTHFKIENGTIRSFNGTLALSSPIKLDIDCVPKAIPFVKAIENCEEAVALTLTPAKRLGIKSGKFKAFIDCVHDEETPHVEPEGEMFDVDGESLIGALKLLFPLIGNDASRQWTTGILLNGQSAMATNNVMLAEYWLASSFPIVVNIPRQAVQEMLRIKEAPISAQATGNSITFHYEGERWIRTALLSNEWQDMSPLFEGNPTPAPVEDTLFEGLAAVAPFADDMGRVYFNEGVLYTSLTEGEGASYAVPNMPHHGVYQIDMLKKLEGVATSIDMSQYPRPATFFGDRLRGVLVGIKE